MDGLQASHHHPGAPGLEVDRRDDQFPTPYRVQFSDDDKAPSWARPAPNKIRICGFRRTTFWLSLAVVVILVLAATGAGVAGSLAASRKSDLKKISTPSAQPADSSPTSSSSLPHTTPSACVPPVQSATPSSSCDNSTSTMQPTTNCKSLPALYTDQVSKAQFDVSCETDYAGNDMLGVYVYKFETCIDACADLNQRNSNTPCSGVSYDVTMSPQERNCFLKASGVRQVATTKNSTSSAMVRTS